MRDIAFVCLVSAFSCIACSAGYASTSSEAPEEAPDPTLNWPKDAKGLVVHLNTWDRAELEAVERPDLDLQKHLAAEAGDAGEWVSLHKKKLEALGVTVTWNAEARRYEIAPN